MPGNNNEPTPGLDASVTVWKRVSHAPVAGTRNGELEHITTGDAFFMPKHSIEGAKEKPFPNAFSLPTFNSTETVTLGSLKGFYIVVLSPLSIDQEKETIRSFSINHQYLHSLITPYQDKLPIYVVTSNPEHNVHTLISGAQIDANTMHFLSDPNVTLAKQLGTGTFKLPEEEDVARPVRENS